MHTFIQCMCKMFCYTHTLHIYCLCLSITSTFVRTPKSTLELHNAMYNIAENISYMHVFFKLSGFQPCQFKQRQHIDLVWSTTFFSRLFSISFFDILQIHSESIQICSGCIAPTCTPLAAGLIKCYVESSLWRR
jgi:hypothetical protein